MENTEQALFQQIEMIKELNEVNLENIKRYLDKIWDKMDEHETKINQMHTAPVSSGKVFNNGTANDHSFKVKYII